MPIYEYQCQVCDHKQEIMHRFSEEPSENCAECGGNELKKLISAVGFQLKGTGWYETDFKNSGGPKDKSTSEDTASGKKDPDKKKSNDGEKKSATSESKAVNKKTASTKSD